MLKKEHILCKINSGRIKPQWFSPQDPELLQCAGTLIGIYQNALDFQMTAAELDELTKTFADSSMFPKVCAGLNKLLSDRCSFKLAGESDYPALRKELFQRSAAALKSGVLPESSPQDIYGDLPGFEKLGSMPQTTPEELLNHFNLAQAQALLIYAKEVTLQITDAETSSLRRVMKAIKFFRLLADFSAVKKNTVQIRISGPYSLFGAAARYAVSLASLLPVMVTLKQWKLEADINWRDRQLKLKLSEKSDLTSPQRAFSSYVPEEIRLYHRLFAEKSEEWQIVGETPFLDAGNQEIIFPDLSFKHKESGEIIHLELFHRWHSAQLERRLELLRQNPELPLMLGIDRALADENQLAELTAGDEILQQRCWLFRDFPGVENTRRALKRTAAVLQMHCFQQL